MEMNQMTELTVNTSKLINAPMEAVFEAWMDPELLSKFMIPGEGMSVSKAEADARQGGRFTIVMAAGDQEIPHGGTYLEVVPHSRLVFTWESPFSVEGSTVTLSLTPAENGATQLQLVHEKFADQQSRDNHDGGWQGILNKLAEVVA